ncbi:MAG: hypothetical protein JNJ54_10395 [Myxococcaceae bacterium]|nr:hypothetical protein [Myxococcaceae bacterium]
MFCILLDRVPPPTLATLLRATLTPPLDRVRAERRSSLRQRYLEAGYSDAEADRMIALVVDQERDEPVVKQLKAKGPWAVCISTLEGSLWNAEAPGLELIEATAAALANESGRGVWLFLDRPSDLRAASLDARGKRRWAAPAEGEEPEYSKEPLKRVAKELKVSLRALAALRLEAARAPPPRGVRVQEAPRLWTVLDAKPEATS